MIFEEKYFSPYILLTEQTSLPDFLNFLRYLVIRALELQKQPSGAVHRKRCSENIQHIYRRTPMPKWVFSCKFAAYFQNTFFQGTPLDGCFCNYLSFSLWRLNFEINLSINIRLSFYLTKNSGQKCIYLKKEKSFQHEIKQIASDLRVCLYKLLKQ